MLILAVTGLGALFDLPILLELALWVLAAASAYTVVFRILKVRRQAIAPMRPRPPVVPE